MLKGSIQDFWVLTPEHSKQDFFLFHENVNYLNCK